MLLHKYDYYDVVNDGISAVTGGQLTTLAVHLNMLLSCYVVRSEIISFFWYLIFRFVVTQICCS